MIVKAYPVPAILLQHFCNYWFDQVADEAVKIYINYHYYLYVGRCSSVGIATDYGLDGPGIESRLGRDFPHLSRPDLRPTQPPVQWVPGPSRG